MSSTITIRLVHDETEREIDSIDIDTSWVVKLRKIYPDHASQFGLRTARDGFDTPVGERVAAILILALLTGDMPVLLERPEVGDEVAEEGYSSFRYAVEAVNSNTDQVLLMRNGTWTIAQWDDDDKTLTDDAEGITFQAVD